MSKKLSSTANLTSKAVTGRSIGQNLRITGKMVNTAIKAGTSKIKGQK